MKIEDVNSILTNPNMQKEQCNFKLTKSKPGKPPQWFADWYAVFSEKLFGRLDKLEEFKDEMTEFKNMVLDQFKQHNWIK